MFEDHLTTLNTAWVYPGSGDGYVFEFAVNLQTLNYLQTINLLDEAELSATLEYMQTSIFILVPQILDCCWFLAKRYYVTFSLWHEPSVCHLSVVCRQ